MAVKNVIFNVSANTKNAEDSLNKLIEQLEKIKAGSKISLTQSTGNLDAQISALSSKLDKLAKDNVTRAQNTNKKINQSDAQLLDASIKFEEKKAKERNDAWAEYDNQINANNQKFTQAANEQVKTNKAAEDEKARQMKELFDARDKEQKKRQAENKKITQEEIKENEVLLRGKKAAQQIIDADFKKQDQEERKRKAQKRADDTQQRRLDAAARKQEREDAKKLEEQRAAQARAEQRDIRGGFNRPGARQRGQDFGAIGNQINFVARAVANSSSNFVRLQNVIARTGVALGAITAGSAVATLGRQALEAAKNYEVLKVSFTTLLGNAAFAEQKIKELRKFAAETPFTTDEVFKSSRILLGYGLEANKLISTLRTLGDIAGGTGAPIERLALVFGQVRAAGRLYGQDLLQLINAGFNPLQEISDNTGKSIRELRDEMRKGNITFEEVNDAFIRATSAGGRFYNLTNALADTTAGKVARLKEEWQTLSIQIGQGLLPAFNFLVSALRNVIEFLKNLPKFVEENRKILAVLSTVTVYLVTAMFRYAQLRAIVTARILAANIAEKANLLLMGSKRAIISTLSGLYGVLTGRITAATAATNLKTAAVNRLSVAISRNPIGFFISLLTAAGTAYLAFSERVNEATDGFISQAEAFATIEAETEKNTKTQKKALDELVVSIQKTNTASKERQVLLNEFNKLTGITIENIADETIFLGRLSQAYNEAAISAEEFQKAQAITSVKGQVEQQLTDLKAKIFAGLADIYGAGTFSWEQLFGITEEQAGFKNLQKNIKTGIENLDLPLAADIPGVTQFVDLLSGLNTTEQKQAKENLENILSLVNQLIATNDLIGGLGLELEKQKSQLAFDPNEDDRIQKATDSFDDAFKRRKDALEEYNDLLNRYRKNDEDIRKKGILFLPPTLFEDEIKQIKDVQKIEEEGIAREIKREQDKIRRQIEDTKLLTELEEKATKLRVDIKNKADKETEEDRKKKVTEGLQAELDAYEDAINQEKKIVSQKNQSILLLEKIKAQEIEILYIENNKKINDIERQGLNERRKLIQETKDAYSDLRIFKLENEFESLNELKDKTDEFLDSFFDVKDDGRAARRLRKIAREVIVEGKNFTLRTQKEIDEETKRIKASQDQAIADAEKVTQATISGIDAQIKAQKELIALKEIEGEDTGIEESKIQFLTQQRTNAVREGEDKITEIRTNSNTRLFELTEDYFAYLRRKDQELIANSVAREDENISKIIENAEVEKQVYRNKTADFIRVENKLNEVLEERQKIREKRASVISDPTLSEQQKQNILSALSLEESAADGRVKIYQDLYDEEKLIVEENGYEIARITAQTELAVTKAHDDGTKERENITESTSEKERETRKKFLELSKEDQLDAIKQVTDALLDFTQVFIDAQIRQTEAAINAQQRRVDAAKEIADKGNVALLKAEQDRLDKLNRQRANFVRQQQNLAAVEIALNSAVAVAKAAGQPGAPFTIVAIIAAMAAGFAQARAQAQSAATFAKGGYTGDGHQFQAAGTVHKGEFVMNAQRTRQYRPMLEAMHAGRIPNLGKGLIEKNVVINNRSMDDKLSRIENAIKEQNRLQLSIDENGINGIVSRISYKQKRINNRTR